MAPLIITALGPVPYSSDKVVPWIMESKVITMVLSKNLGFAKMKILKLLTSM